jgi:hypothetical protein
MELDLQKILSDKIRREEYNPIAWKKNEVWNHVGRGSKINRKPLFYYAAASLLLAAVLISYLLQSRVYTRLNDRIRILEAALDQPINPSTLKSAIAFTAPEDCESVPARKTKNKPKRIIAKNNLTLINSSTIQTNDAEDKPAVSDALIQQVSKETSVPDAGSEAIPLTPGIEVIIGFIPKIQERMVVQKLKKIRLRLLKGNERTAEVWPYEVDTKIITARIN